MANKQLIRLTEGDLHRIIKESLKKIGDERKKEIVNKLQEPSEDIVNRLQEPFKGKPIPRRKTKMIGKNTYTK